MHPVLAAPLRRDDSRRGEVPAQYVAVAHYLTDATRFVRRATPEGLLLEQGTILTPPGCHGEHLRLMGDAAAAGVPAGPGTGS